MKNKRAADQVITKVYCSRANVNAILDRKITDAEWKHCKKNLLEYEFTHDDGETAPLEDVVRAWEEEYNLARYIKAHKK